MEEVRNSYKILFVKFKRNDNLEDIDVDGMIILKCIFKEIVREDVVWIHLTQDTIY
jgi:hypothetical protein